MRLLKMNPTTIGAFLIIKEGPVFIEFIFEPLPPSDAVRKQKKIFQRIFSAKYCHNSKNITPLETINLVI